MILTIYPVIAFNNNTFRQQLTYRPKHAGPTEIIAKHNAAEIEQLTVILNICFHIFILMAGIYNPSITQRLNNLVERTDQTTQGDKITNFELTLKI